MLETKPRPLSAQAKSLIQMAGDIWAAEARAHVDPAPPAPARPRYKPERWELKIDFHAVEPHQLDIDRRLRNWGTWCTSTPHAASAPMFRLAVPAARARAYGSVTAEPVDRSDAIRIARAVAALPRGHAAALHWAYIKPVSPRKACQSIGTTLAGLAKLLTDGRQMLVNRGV
ncbi:hypothetical protein [Variovorax sp. JS1663]|uniref:hypothetical protein n=1 Tax=Variovorax sp. JS1663 TaxID=1851577 RepID=UPI000B3488AE|nr:hypothetical protein [Variovorax sp. JS1663]OUM01656.1 hypothetical protein A8M77_15395 [Variovorax sp. JS1663]